MQWDNNKNILERVNQDGQQWVQDNPVKESPMQNVKPRKHYLILHISWMKGYRKKLDGPRKKGRPQIDNVSDWFKN